MEMEIVTSVEQHPQVPASDWPWPVRVARGPLGVLVWGTTPGVGVVRGIGFLDVHSRVPFFDGDVPSPGCPLLDGAPCYADGASGVIRDVADVADYVSWFPAVPA